MIQTVDNFYLSNLEKKTKKEIENASGYYAYYDNLKKSEELLYITLNDYKDEKFPNNIFFSFFKDEEKIKSKNEDDLIISIKKDIAKDGKDNYLAQTGNYVGKFKWQGLEIDIKSRFSNTFLERMLNFANDIFLDDVSITGNKIDKDFDISKYIFIICLFKTLKRLFYLDFQKLIKV